MSESTNHDEEINPKIGPIWIKYLESVQVLINYRIDKKRFSQYMTFRDRAFKIVKGEKFIKSLENGRDDLSPEILEALLSEMEAFSHTVEIAKIEKKSKSKALQLVKRFLPQASVVAGSAKDILPVSDYAKKGMILFKELIDVFK